MHACTYAMAQSPRQFDVVAPPPTLSLPSSNFANSGMRTIPWRCEHIALADRYRKSGVISRLVAAKWLILIGNQSFQPCICTQQLDTIARQYNIIYKRIYIRAIGRRTAAGIGTVHLRLSQIDRYIPSTIVRYVPGARATDPQTYIRNGAKNGLAVGKNSKLPEPFVAETLWSPSIDPRPFMYR